MRGRTITAIALLVLALTLFLISCENPASEKVQVEELVDVSFDGDSRSLSVELAAFDKTKLYWKYAAKKTVSEGNEMLDGSGLRSGETKTFDEAGAVPVTIDFVPGLGAKIPGFSQGLWDFKLFGYAKRTGEGTESSPYKYEGLAYYGDTTMQSLNKQASNSVSVTVSPLKDEDKGRLVVDIDNILFNKASTASTPADFEKRVFINDVKQTPATEVAIGEYAVQSDLAPGEYNVKVQFVHKVGTVEYILAEGKVTATVYSNIQTRVYGDLSELVTYAQFDATDSYPGLPQGTITKTQSSTTKVWTLTLTSTNAASVPTTYAWYVDDVQQDETRNTFTYTPGVESVNITCVFGNTSGTGSASVTID